MRLFLGQIDILCGERVGIRTHDYPRSVYAIHIKFKANEDIVMYVLEQKTRIWIRGVNATIHNSRTFVRCYNSSLVAPVSCTCSTIDMPVIIMYSVGTRFH